MRRGVGTGGRGWWWQWWRAGSGSGAGWWIVSGGWWFSSGVLGGGRVVRGAFWIHIQRLVVMVTIGKTLAPKRIRSEAAFTANPFQCGTLYITLLTTAARSGHEHLCYALGDVLGHQRWHNEGM